MNTTTNSSSAAEGIVVNEGMRLFISVCMSCIIAMSFCGNVLVCLAFKVNERLRSVSNYFILNLAISDLLTTIFVMPFDLDIIVKRYKWGYGETMCHFYTTMYLISAPASILNLLAVSIDRYRVISDPFLYERTTTPRRALIVIAFIWTYATIMALLPLMGWKENIDVDTDVVCYFPIAFNYSITISVLHFVIPPLIMAIIYFKIYKIARSHVRRIHRLECASSARPAVLSPDNGGANGGKHRPSSKVLLSPPKHQEQCNNGVNGHSPLRMLKRRFTYRYSVSAPPMLRKNVNAAKSLAVIVGTFFVCWYPFTAVSMTVNACGGLQGGCYVASYVFDCLITIGYLNSVINPFLYAFHNAEFKKTYKKILRMRWK